MITVSVFVDGKQVAQYQEDGSREISIGRSPGCVIRLADPSVSRLHAVINQTEGNWVLEKKATLGSLIVNGGEIENAILAGGEELVVSTFVLRVNIEGKSAPALDNATGFEDSKASVHEPAAGDKTQAMTAEPAASDEFGALSKNKGCECCSCWFFAL